MLLTFNTILVLQIGLQQIVKEKIFKVNKGIIRKLRSILPRNALLTIYKSFIRPNLDYCDFIYYQPHN